MEHPPAFARARARNRSVSVASVVEISGSWLSMSHVIGRYAMFWDVDILMWVASLAVRTWVGWNRRSLREAFMASVASGAHVFVQKTPIGLGCWASTERKYFPQKAVDLAKCGPEPLRGSPRSSCRHREKVVETWAHRAASEVHCGLTSALSIRGW